MINNKSYLYLAATAVTSAIVASLATFFIVKHAFNKNKTTFESIESNICSIKDDIKTLKTNTKQKRPQTFYAKTTEYTQNNQAKKQPVDEENENMKKFNTILLEIQGQSFDQIHKKNSKTLTKYLESSRSMDNSDSKVVHKTNGRPFQNILVEDYYEIEANKVRTIFLPIEINSFDNFYHDVVNSSSTKIDLLKSLNFGNEIKKEDTHIIKEAIDAYCLSCDIKNTVNDSLKYLNNNRRKIAGFLISEYTLQNHTNSYRTSFVTFQ
ncbi:MAG: hypothetical protein IJG00_01840 [Clostridia bacterium]|nr:hypothetical protein [Clostridia bacterium]